MTNKKELLDLPPTDLCHILPYLFKEDKKNRIFFDKAPRLNLVSVKKMSDLHSFFTCESTLVKIFVVVVFSPGSFFYRLVE